MNLNWQMKLLDQPLKGGSDLTVADKTKLDERFVLTLKDVSGSSEKFIAYGAVCVGGKNYLLVENTSDEEELMVVRLLDKDRIVTMDQDRFSSLRNAFELSLYSNAIVTGAALEALLSS